MYTKQSYPNYIGIGTESGGFICEWDPFAVKLKIPRNRGVCKIVVWGTSNMVIFLERLGDKKCFIYDSESK
jgi:WD40 repeat protein